MSMVFEDNTKAALLELLRSTFNGWTIGLFVSNHTPLGTDTASTYTAIEATFTGYSRQALTSLATAFANGSGQGETDGTLMTWVVTATAGSDQVYGWFALDGGGAFKVAEKRGSGPVPMSSLGDLFALLPTVLLGNL